MLGKLRYNKVKWYYFPQVKTKQQHSLLSFYNHVFSQVKVEISSYPYIYEILLYSVQNIIYIILY